MKSSHEKNLLKIYQRHNPSETTNYNKNKKINLDLLNYRLKIPINLLNKNLSIADIACGTGEITELFGQNGNNVKGYDFNPISIKIAKKRNKKKNIKFFVSNFFSIKGTFDIVTCFGALHHLRKPYKGLKFLEKKVKKGGLLVFSVGMDVDNTQHNLMKIISRLFGSNQENIIKYSEFFFKEHIDRCVKYGLRSRKAVINDQFINNYHDYLNFDKMMKILKRYQLFSVFPYSGLYRNDSALNDTIFSNQSSIIKNLKFGSSRNIMASESDQKRLNKFYNSRCKKLEKFSNSLNNKINQNPYKVLNNSNKILSGISNKLIDRYDEKKSNKFLRELKILLKQLLKTNENNKNVLKKKINSFEILFNGTRGTGLKYFVFKKS